jgi:hypothetical protein
MPDLPIYALEGVTGKVINTAIWQLSLGNLEHQTPTLRLFLLFFSFLFFSSFLIAKLTRH